jgi:hypothetical protein
MNPDPLGTGGLSRLRPGMNEPRSWAQYQRRASRGLPPCSIIQAYSSAMSPSRNGRSRAGVTSASNHRASAGSV